MTESTTRPNQSAPHVPLSINGEAIETEEWFSITDPAAPRRIVGYAASASADHSRRAVDAAHTAWKTWRELAPEERAGQLLSALGRLEVEHGERVELLVGENGKVVAEAEVELGVFIGRCRLAAQLAPELSRTRELPRLDTRPQPELRENSSAPGGSGHAEVRPRTAPAFRSRVSALPLGVVTIIVPYNWPLAILAASLPYALVAGCTVIVKPPPTTPLCVGRTLQLLAAALPPGVLNVVTGTNEAVAPLIQHRQVSRIVFTGSTNAGKAMMRMAADNLARVTLELGGNDPAFVLEDATLDRATLQRLVAASFTTSGQVCMGVKRLYVHRTRYAEVVNGMSEILGAFRVGHGLSRNTTMGPLNTARQRDFVAELCAEARAHGHEVRELGTLEDPSGRDGGYFLRPALVLDPAPNLRIVTDEQFGPALPILPFDDVDPIIDQVNEEWSGLCSSVWTSDLERAARLAARLHTGTTWVNDANAVAQDDRAPFGGFRQSGLGRELGIEGLLEFTEAHTVTYPA
jgi:acyl-CoA reductase-like NAD-dependent aldehyde dehydrogenase